MLVAYNMIFENNVSLGHNIENIDQDMTVMPGPCNASLAKAIDIMSVSCFGKSLKAYFVVWYINRFLKRLGRNKEKNYFLTYLIY